MQDADVRKRSSGAQIPAAMLESVRELNLHFLDLIANPPLGWNPSSRTALSMELCGQIAPLTTEQKRAAADCPYALFDLQFQDAGHWQVRLQSTGLWAVSDIPTEDDKRVNFVRLAIFFAWHVASMGTLAAQVLLGMSEGTSGAFRDATIGCLPALAATESGNLSARWSDRPAYWNALSRAAARPNMPALRRIQLYGLQLAAAARLA
jgi:hypothetical protein